MFMGALSLALTPELFLDMPFDVIDDEAGSDRHAWCGCNNNAVIN
jgi:hypothetical protein